MRGIYTALLLIALLFNFLQANSDNEKILSKTYGICTSNDYLNPNISKELRLNACLASIDRASEMYKSLPEVSDHKFIKGYSYLKIFRDSFLEYYNRISYESSLDTVLMLKYVKEFLQEVHLVYNFKYKRLSQLLE